MKKFRKALSVLVMTAMVTSIASCGLVKDKSMDEIEDLAEDVCKYTADLDYKKLSKMTEDGDEDLEAMFEGIEDDDFRKIVASTLEYEIDEDSLEKDGKTGYTIDVTFTYVNYEEVLEDDEIFSVDDFEDAVDDCDEVVEESITLEFEKDGDDILFVNISDLEDLFPYWDEFLAPDLTTDVDEDEYEDEDEDEDDDDTEPSMTTSDDTEPSDTTAPSGTTGSQSDREEFTGQPYQLPDTNIIFTNPDGMTADDMSDDSYLLISGYSFENGEYCAYMIMDGADRAYDSDFASSFIDTYYDMYSDISPSTDGYSYSAEYRDVVVEGTAFRGVLITTTRDDGTVTYKLVFIIGDDDKYYIVTVDGNMELVDSFGSCFTYC